MRFTLALLAVLATSMLATSNAALVARGQSPAAAEITFTKHVAPILQNRCQICHRPDTFAPMSLISYEQAQAVGPRDQDESGRAPDAAVLHR